MYFLLMMMTKLVTAGLGSRASNRLPEIILKQPLSLTGLESQPQKVLNRIGCCNGPDVHPHEIIITIVIEMIYKYN